MPKIKIEADVRGVPFGAEVVTSFIAQLQRYVDNTNSTNSQLFAMRLRDWELNRRISSKSDEEFASIFGPRPTPPKKLDFNLTVRPSEFGGLDFDYEFVTLPFDVTSV
jgi:hypothetical protein